MCIKRLNTRAMMFYGVFGHVCKQFRVTVNAILVQMSLVTQL